MYVVIGITGCMLGYIFVYWFLTLVMYWVTTVQNTSHNKSTIYWTLRLSIYPLLYLKYWTKSPSLYIYIYDALFPHLPSLLSRAMHGLILLLIVHHDCYFSVIKPFYISVELLCCHDKFYLLFLMLTWGSCNSFWYFHKIWKKIILIPKWLIYLLLLITFRSVH